MARNITVSPNHWCDGCGDYFSLQNPGAIFKNSNSVMRLCVSCLESASRDCKRVAHKELLEVGA